MSERTPISPPPGRGAAACRETLRRAATLLGAAALLAAGLPHGLWAVEAGAASRPATATEPATVAPAAPGGRPMSPTAGDPALIPSRPLPLLTIAPRRAVAAGPPAAAGPGDPLPLPRAASAADDCRLEMRRSERPKIAFLNFFWHRRDEFRCTVLRPRGGPVAAGDTAPGGYWDNRFRRLAAYGVDVLGFVFTGFDRPDRDVAGQTPHSVRHGRNLMGAIPRARDAGLPFFVYYDLAVRTALKSRRCKVAPPAADHVCANPALRPVDRYDLTDRQLYRQLRRDLLRILDEIIVPNRDVYYMLERQDGTLATDERGLPRPVVAIYIARTLAPNRGIERLAREMTAHFRRRGLGRPAFVLDTIFWNDPLRADIVARFGPTAAAVTSFFPVNPIAARELGVRRLKGWVRPMKRLYAAAAEDAAGAGFDHLQIWPGVAAMFDNRRQENAVCPEVVERMAPEMSFLLRGEDDWRRMLRMGYDSAREPERVCPAGVEAPPAAAAGIQSLVIDYDNEFRESAVTDCVTRPASGGAEFPFRFGCRLMSVVLDEDRFP